MKFSVGDVVTDKYGPRGGLVLEYEVIRVLPNSIVIWGIHPSRPKSDYIYARPDQYKLLRKASKLHKVLE